MLFNSVQFAVFLPIVFILYWNISHKYRWVLLLAASYIFYMFWSVKYVFLLIFPTLVSYYAAIVINRHRKIGKKTLVISIILCLTELFWFKYVNFFLDTVFAIIGLVNPTISATHFNIILPVGVSFYTFQTISYIVDVYRGHIEPELNIGVYAAYVSFFPQLVAGPIERSGNLMPQIKQKHEFDYDKAVYGLKLMTIGFYKKIVIADNLAVYVDKVYSDLHHYHGFSLVIAAFFFSLQIYCDFSGYSDIAIGTAKMFGIDLMENFKQPYLSSSIREFWSRWHISLSSWLRDYVYIPLGGNRRGNLRKNTNLITTFLLSGLWHGAGWNFVIWGGSHGLINVSERYLPIREKPKGIIKWIRVGIVFILTTAAWVLFRVQALPDAIYIFTHIIDGVTRPVSYFYSGFKEIDLSKRKIIICVLFYLIPLLIYDMASEKINVLQWISQKNVVIRWISYITVLYIIIQMAYFAIDASFIYFQF